MSQHSVTLVVCKLWTLQVYLTRYGYTGMILSPSWRDELSYPCLTVKEGCVAFQSNSASLWVTCGLYLTDKPSIQLYCYTHFHPHTSCNWTGCAIYSTCERFCFHQGQNRKLHTLPPSFATKTMSLCVLAVMRCYIMRLSDLLGKYGGCTCFHTLSSNQR